MESVLEYIQSNFLALAGIALSFISIILAVIYKSKKRLNIYFKTHEVYVAGTKNANKRLMISYDGESVEKMYISYLYIWNSGSKTIDKTEIVDKLKLQVNNSGKFLDSTVVKQSRNTCKIASEITSNASVDVTFEYLDNKDGAYIELLHTETVSSFIWTIKGTKIHRCKQITMANKEKKAEGIIITSFLLILLSVIFIATIGTIINGMQLHNANIIYLLLYIISELFLIGLMLLFIRLVVISRFINRIPKSLRT